MQSEIKSFKYALSIFIRLVLREKKKGCNVHCGVPSHFLGEALAIDRKTAVIASPKLIFQDATKAKLNRKCDNGLIITYVMIVSQLLTTLSSPVLPGIGLDCLNLVYSSINFTGITPGITADETPETEH